MGVFLLSAVSVNIIRRCKTLAKIELKQPIVEEIKENIKDAKSVVLVDYRGLTVEQITKLRGSLREKDSQLKVIKNNFARVAFEEMNNKEVAQYLSGPTAIAMVGEDANESAKILFDFIKDAPALSVKGAWVDNELYDAAKIEALSKLPGKKQLIAMLMSAINGPAQKLAATLQAYVDKLEKEGPAAAAPEAAPAEAPAPAAE